MIYTLISDLNNSFEFDNEVGGKLPVNKNGKTSSKKDSHLSLTENQSEANNCDPSADKAAVEDKNNEITKNKRDCCVLRQPLSLFPENIEKLITSTKNPLTREERRLAYTTLLCGLKAFFGIDNRTVDKTKDGKPYLVSLDSFLECECSRVSPLDSISSVGEKDSKSSALSSPPSSSTPLSLLTESSSTLCLKNNDGFITEKYGVISDEKIYQKNEDLSTQNHQHQKNVDFCTDDSIKNAFDHNDRPIHISISHSDGVIAVSISDEGEVGVDIQSEIAIDIAERLDKRFLSGLQTKNEKLNILYYYCSIAENEAVFTKIDLPESEECNFNTKWSCAESVLKLYGRGFGDLNKLSDFLEMTHTEIKCYISKSSFAVSTSIKA